MAIADKFALLEALLWFAVGFFALYACRAHFAPRQHALVRVTGGLFLLLGAASVAEFSVAAVSAPFWLLAWKTGNLAALLLCVGALFWRHRRGEK